MTDTDPTNPTADPLGPAGEPTWSQVWQLPALVLGLGMFLLGLWVVAPTQVPDDFDGALDTVKYYLEDDSPKVDDPLAHAHAKLEEIAARLQAATDPQKARFYQYYADLHFEQTNRPGIEPVETKISRKTNEGIIGRYIKAEDLGGEITGSSLFRYAQTLVALGRDSDAVALLDRMQNEPAEQRYNLVKKLIQKQRGLAEPDYETLSTLVMRFKAELARETDAKRLRREQIWLAGLQADLKLEAGDPNGAIRLLVMERLPRLQKPGRSNNDLAPLRVKLAQAYQDTAAFEDAQRNYEEALAMLAGDSGNDLRAAILVGLGQIELSRPGDNSVATAHEFFAQADEQFRSSEYYIDALIGRADCEARMGQFDHSIRHFNLAVEHMLERTPKHDPRRQLVTDVVDAHVARSVDEEAYGRTLELLETLVPLYGGKLPAPQVLRFAVTHERIAEQRAIYADQVQADLEAGKPGASVDARRQAHQDAVIHNELAGDYYREHAHRVTRTDDDAHGESLWRAASCYDRAQLWSRAIEVYGEFVRDRTTDPMLVRARAELGKALLADGQYEAAIEQFLELAEQHPHSPETYDILVPLAQAYIAIDEPSAARRGLEQVVTDHPSISPDSPEYEYALIELGKLLYRLGEDNPDYYITAIERLTEAVERYGNGEQGPTLRYLLADAYRKSIAQIQGQLAESQSKNDQLALQAERTQRLTEAEKLYNQVVNELETRPQVSITPMEQLYRRNAYFYQADCAFDRGAYEMAISLYDIAARRFENHPASLIAMVQIVNAHCELGQYQEARVANQQAQWQLQRIPDEAFNDPELPLTRRHWEDWLRWTSQLDVFGPKASAQ